MDDPEVIMIPEEFLAFVRLVSGMRHLQRSYFKYRRDRDLVACKDHERRVDDLARDFLANQSSLFGGDPK